MEHSPLVHVLFCAVGVIVLKEINSVVTKPYMVRVILLVVTSA